MNPTKLGRTEGGAPFKNRTRLGQPDKAVCETADNQEEVNMKKTVFLGALTVAGLAAGVAAAGTLDDVKARGKLNCGVTTGLVGFAAPDANGEWDGFDVAVCRAVAAAVLGDPKAVEFVPTTGKTRFTALASGEVDMLARNTTWTFSRDVDLKFTFVGVNYYDGQGFMVPKSLGVSSAKELDGATVCIQTGTTTELNLADFFRSNNISYEPVPIETNAEGQQQYLAGACDVPTPPTHRVWPQRVQRSKIRVITWFCRKSSRKSRWARSSAMAMTNGAMWCAGRLNALIAAEELGVTSANIGDMAAAPGDNPEINRLLGTEGNLGEMLGLSADWAKNAIAAGGNYGEIFEKNIGEATPIGLWRAV